MRSSCRRLGLLQLVTGVILLVSLSATSCGPDEPEGPIVAEVGGDKISLDQVRTEFDNRERPGEFDKLTREQKEMFLATIADKEVLLRLSRKEYGGLVAPYDRLLREANERRLVSALEVYLSLPPSRDSVAINTMLEQFNKEIRVSWLINPSDSLANVARDRISAGEDFELVAKKYSKESPEKFRTSRGQWRTGAAVTEVFVEELFLEGHGPGYLSQVRAGPLGYELFRIEEVRETDISKRDITMRALDKIVRSILVRRRVDGWTDSLKDARSLELHEETLPILNMRMKEYWDGIAADPDAGKEVATAYESPISAFSEDERGMTLYETVDGAVTISDFAEDLRAVPMKLWPSGLSIDHDRKSVERRILFAWQVEIARELGFEDDSRLRRLAEIDEEKYLIEQMHEEIAAKIDITDEDIEKYYIENKESYRSGDVIRFSYIVFPTEAEAKSFAAEAQEETGTWWVGRLSEFRRERPDIHTVPNSEDYDLTQPVPEEVRGMVELGRDKGVTDVLEAVEFPSGGWVVGRVIRRDLPGYRPLEKVSAGLRIVLTNRTTTEEMEKLIESGRESLNLKLYPENLEEPDTLQTEAAS